MLAVTIAASHIEWIRKFSVEAGVDYLVQPLLCDAAHVPGNSCFDAAVAIESSCHFSRNTWFPRLYTLLRPSERVFIADYFAKRYQTATKINRHWNAQVGTVPEYVTLARAAGFREENIQDISHDTKHFWTTTAALINSEFIDNANKSVDAIEIESVRKSEQIHCHMHDLLDCGDLNYMLMSFSKP